MHYLPLKHAHALVEEPLVVVEGREAGAHGANDLAGPRGPLVVELLRQRVAARVVHHHRRRAVQQVRAVPLQRGAEEQQRRVELRLEAHHELVLEPVAGHSHAAGSGRGVGMLQGLLGAR